jgi:hypothetical protein
VRAPVDADKARVTLGTSAILGQWSRTGGAGGGGCR